MSLEFSGGRLDQQAQRCHGRRPGRSVRRRGGCGRRRRSRRRGRATGGGTRREAELQGRKPVWAAIKGAWTGGNTKVKIGVVSAGVILARWLVLSPVLLVVLLLTGLVALAVSRARSAKK